MRCPGPTFGGSRVEQEEAVVSRRAVVTTWEALPSEVVRAGVSRRAIGTEDVTCVLNRIEPAMQAAPHVHEGFDQLAFILSGQAIYHVGDVGHEVGPGAAMLIPAGVPHWIEPNGDEPIENLDVFAPAREDYAHLVEWMDDPQAPAHG
ncbi:MAG: cupin domain-containing protein [Acidimicrobiales bacterium]